MHARSLSPRAISSHVSLATKVRDDNHACTKLSSGQLLPPNRARCGLFTAVACPLCRVPTHQTHATMTTQRVTRARQVFRRQRRIGADENFCRFNDFSSTPPGEHALTHRFVQIHPPHSASIIAKRTNSKEMCIARLVGVVLVCTIQSIRTFYLNSLPVVRRNECRSYRQVLLSRVIVALIGHRAHREYPHQPA